MSPSTSTALEPLLQPGCGIYHTTKSTTGEILAGQEAEDCGQVSGHEDPDGAADTNTLGKPRSVVSQFIPIINQNNFATEISEINSLYFLTS